MKRIFTKFIRCLISLVFIILITSSVFAQISEKMSYQAVVRDAANKLVVSKTIGIQISIQQGSATGTVVYTETQKATTNINGLATLEIGGGAGFSSIDWTAGPFFIVTKFDLAGGSNYTITGSSQILSVPFALAAGTAYKLTGPLNEKDPVFTAWDKSTGIQIKENQITDLKHFTSSDETDPVFKQWNKSDGILITESQISNLKHFTNANETDPIFGAWNKSTGITIKENQITDLKHFTTADEKDPVFKAWNKSTGIVIQESQISDLKHFTSADEKDPIFSASVAKKIKASDTLRWGQDFDSDPENELQYLFKTNHKISLSDGGFITTDLQDAYYNGDSITTIHGPVVINAHGTGPAIKLIDGRQANNRVLMSDAYGNARWDTISTQNIQNFIVYNEDVASNAEIQVSKLHEGLQGQLLVSNGNSPVWTGAIGDVLFPMDGFGHVVSAIQLDSVTASEINPDVAGRGIIQIEPSGALGLLPDNSTLELTSISPFDTIRVKDLGITTRKLADNAVTTLKIAPNAVDSTKILAGSVLSSEIRDGQVMTVDIADNAVTTLKILDVNVTTPKIADNAVTTLKILDANVTTPKIDDNAVTTLKIAPNAVDSTKILAGSVLSSEIRDGQVMTVDIADNAVTTLKILDANVTTPKIADNAVTTLKIAPNAVDSTKILAGSVLSSEIRDGQVMTVDIADNAVTTLKILDANVTTPKIDDNAVTTLKIAPNAVDSTKILAGSVLSSEIRDGQVMTVDIADNAVTTPKIADNNITTPKILNDAVTMDKLLGGADKQFLVSVGNQPTWVDMSGDVIITNTGVTSIGTGRVLNSMLDNSDITLGTTTIVLGGSSTTLAGLTSVTSTAFSGDLTGDVTGTASNVTGIVAPANGGTGTNNGANTLTIGASASVSGSNTGDNAVNTLYSGLVSNVTTDLSVSGASSPITLNSSDGTDVTFTAGTGITLTGAGGNDITITNSSPDAQNLSLGTTTATNQPIDISGGTGISLPSATTTNAGLMSATDKTILDGIEPGAQVNVNADWNANGGDSQILNKPTSLSDFSNDPGFISSESDPNFGSSAASAIAVGDITNWDAAYGHIALDGDLDNTNELQDLSYDSDTRTLGISSGSGVTLPEVAAAGNSGLMTGSDKTKLDDATNASTPNTIVQRDASGDFSANMASVNVLNGSTLITSATGATFMGCTNMGGLLTSDGSANIVVTLNTTLAPRAVILTAGQAGSDLYVVSRGVGTFTISDGNAFSLGDIVYYMVIY